MCKMCAKKDEMKTKTKGKQDTKNPIAFIIQLNSDILNAAYKFLLNLECPNADYAFRNED